MGWSGDSAAWGTWRRAIECLGVIVLQFGLTDVRGFSLSGGDGPPTIAVTTEEDYRPRIFTLFHEYAHALLGRSGICDPEAALTRRSARVERWCNAFAGAFLVPESSLRNEPTARRIEGVHEPPSDGELAPLINRYQVSRQVIWHRLFTVGLVDDRVYRAKWAQWYRLPSRRTERRRQDRGPRPEWQAVYSRGALTGVLLSAERRGIITTLAAGDYLGVKPQHLDRVSDVFASYSNRGERT
jgi:Zn-dependent peptidase ImmA (M78 family)